MADINMKPYRALPCALQVFTINGIKADKMDFGYTDDGNVEATDPNDIPEYGCYNNHFVVYEDEENIREAMKKYNITKEEYFQICDDLKDTLYVGGCGWCA